MDLTNKPFGQYRILRLLGRGGMGEVYEAEHRVLQRRYALKLLPEDFATRVEAVRRFEREAAVMANLDHAHIIRVDEFGEIEGRYWLRMELVHGVVASQPGAAVCITLGDYVAQKGGKLEQGEFAILLQQILAGLAYAHGKGVVHRDLKPGNILLEQDAAGQLRVKISDFGLARVIGEDFIRNQAQVSVSRSLGDAKTLGVQKSLGDEATLSEGTSTRSLLGTWEYMSPEQRRGDEADARSDVYAVGLMCYRLLTGKELGMRSPSQLNKSLIPAWDEFVAKALEQESSARYANGTEMLTAFAVVESLVGSSRGNAAPPVLPASNVQRPTSKPVIVHRKSKTIPLMTVLMAIVLLLAVRLVWYSFVHQPEVKRQSELARVEAAAHAAGDAKEKARLDAEAERLRTEREKQAAADQAAQVFAAQQTAEAKAKADAEAARQAEAKRQADAVVAQKTAEEQAKAYTAPLRLTEAKPKVDELAGQKTGESENNTYSLSSASVLHTNTAIIPAPRTGAITNRVALVLQRAKDAPGNYDIEFIGDSITQGWESRGSNIWNEFYGQHKVINFGVSGDRTEHVLWRFEQGQLDGIQAKVAIVLIGTNNSNKNKDGTDMYTDSDILDGITAIVQQIRSRQPNTKILLLAIFPRGKVPNSQGDRILRVNQMLSHLADGKNIFYLDIGSQFVQNDGSISASIMPDYLHPNEAGYKIWATAMESKLNELLVNGGSEKDGLALQKNSQTMPAASVAGNAANEVAVINTTEGAMVFEFYPSIAPNHVANFQKLARSGFYDGTCFHRVIPGFMIQGGDPNTKIETGKNTWGMGGPGYSIKAEFNSKHHARGILSMARSNDPNSAGSQFFICHADAGSLDGQYTVFGNLIKGFDVLDKIATTPTEAPDRPLKRININSIKIVPADSSAAQ